MVDFVSTNAMSMLGGDDYTSIQQSIVDLDASVVHKTGNLDESINGKKTFVSDLTVSNKNTTITANAGGDNLMEVTSGNGGNTLRAIGTGTMSGGFNRIIGRSNFYDITAGAHFIRTGVSGSEVNKILVQSTSTTLTNSSHSITATGNNTITTTAGNNQITGYNNIFDVNSLGSQSIRVNGGNKIVVDGANTTLTNGSHSITATGTNTITSANTGQDANVIDSTAAGGGIRLRTTTGQTSITSTSGKIVTATTSTLADGVLLYNGGVGGGVTLRADGTGGTIRLEAAGTNTITSSNSGVSSIANTINATGANSYNRLQQTGSSGQNLIIAAASDNSAVNRIASNAGVNYANQLDAYGAGGNELKNVSGVNYLTTTSGSNRLTVNGSDKIITFSTETYNTNNVIYEIFYSSYNVRWVDSFGSTYTQLAIDGANTLIYNQNSITTRVNGKERIYNQSDRNEYRFNPTGTSTQVWRLYDNGTANVLYCLQSTTALNGVYLPNGANGWSAWSDERIKKNIKPIDTALTDILNLKPVFYNYKGDDDTQALRAGFIAQEVQQVYPDLINESSMDSGDIKNLLGLDMTNLVPYLVKEIQDLNKKVEVQALIIHKLSSAMI